MFDQGWGDIPSPHTKSLSSWGEPAPSPVTVDNGTSAWGKPTGSCGGWGDSNTDTYGRGNQAMTSASCKSGKLFDFLFSFFLLLQMVQIFDITCVLNIKQSYSLSLC